MRRLAWPLLGLLLSAAPALAQDMCCGARSTRFNFTVDYWPSVRRARHEWRLNRDNPAGMDALMEHERYALNRTTSVLPQYHLLTGAAPSRPTAPAMAPADAPPPPTAPAGRPATPRPSGSPGL